MFSDAAGHATNPEERNGMYGAEFGAPITIGDDVWIGGSAILLPGISIGKGCVIGAGSVVVCVLLVQIGFANIVAHRQKTCPTALLLLETQLESSSLCDCMLPTIW